MHENAQKFQGKNFLRLHVATPGTVNTAHLDDALSEPLNWKQAK